MTPNTHVNPGCDVTVDPRPPIDDSFRSRKMEHVCTWTYDETHDSYDTGCGEKYQILVGTPKENKMKFCPFCGKMIEESEQRAGERESITKFCETCDNHIIKGTTRACKAGVVMNPYIWGCVDKWKSKEHRAEEEVK